MANKTHPFGAKLQYDADGIGSYTDLADIRSIGSLDFTRGDAEITHLESANAWREFLGSWKDGGEVPFVGYFTKTQFNTLLETIFALAPGHASTYYWKVLMPLLTGETVNSQVAFQGHLNSVGFNEITINDDVITCPFKLKITGKPTFTAGS